MLKKLNLFRNYLQQFATIYIDKKSCQSQIQPSWTISVSSMRNPRPPTPNGSHLLEFCQPKLSAQLLASHGVKKDSLFLVLSYIFKWGFLQIGDPFWIGCKRKPTSKPPTWVPNFEKRPKSFLCNSFVDWWLTVKGKRLKTQARGCWTSKQGISKEKRETPSQMLVRSIP